MKRTIVRRAFTLIELPVVIAIIAIIFVAGHVPVHDFAKSVKSAWPAGPTANWAWYKSAR